jgi:EmrB/QacA subfamily drug resistance transporter
MMESMAEQNKAADTQHVNSSASPVELDAAPTARRSGDLSSATSPNRVLAIVSVGMILANLDLFVVNVALPTIALDFGSPSLERLSWILNGYTIAYAALLVFFGRLSERYPRNVSFLVGIGAFTAASAACAAATGTEMLVVFRVVQAAAAALMTPTSLGLLLAAFPPEGRSGAVRTWTAVGGLAAALGPLIGGVLVTASWRWIFLVNLPLGLITLVVGWRKLPRIPGHNSSHPHFGAALLVTAGVASLVFAIVKVNDWGWHSPGISAACAATVIFLGWFVAHCLRSSDPFIDPHLFRIRPFTGAALAIAPGTAAFGALLLSMVLWDQMIWGWSALKIGLAMAPGPLLIPVVSLLFSRRLIARFGVAAVCAAGTISFALGLVWWAVMPGLEASFLVATIGMLPIGLGAGLLSPTLMGVSTSSLPPSSFATGSGAINMIRQVAIAVGVAVLVAILGEHHAVEEWVQAFRVAWWIMAAVTLIGLVPTLLFIGPSAGTKIDIRQATQQQTP